jgi:hypothetical protein
MVYALWNPPMEVPFNGNSTGQAPVELNKDSTTVKYASLIFFEKFNMAGPSTIFRSYPS